MADKKLEDMSEAELEAFIAKSEGKNAPAAPPSFGVHQPDPMHFQPHGEPPPMHPFGKTAEEGLGAAASSTLHGLTAGGFEPIVGALGAIGDKGDWAGNAYRRMNELEGWRQEREKQAPWAATAGKILGAVPAMASGSALAEGLGEAGLSALPSLGLRMGTQGLAQGAQAVGTESPLLITPEDRAKALQTGVSGFTGGALGEAGGQALGAAGRLVKSQSGDLAAIGSGRAINKYRTQAEDIAKQYPGPGFPVPTREELAAGIQGHVDQRFPPNSGYFDTRASLGNYVEDIKRPQPPVQISPGAPGIPAQPGTPAAVQYNYQTPFAAPGKGFVGGSIPKNATGPQPSPLSPEQLDQFNQLADFLKADLEYKAGAPPLAHEITPVSHGGNTVNMRPGNINGQSPSMAFGPTKVNAPVAPPGMQQQVIHPGSPATPAVPPQPPVYAPAPPQPAYPHELGAIKHGLQEKAFDQPALQDKLGFRKPLIARGLEGAAGVVSDAENEMMKRLLPAGDARKFMQEKAIYGRAVPIQRELQLQMGKPPDVTDFAAAGIGATLTPRAYGGALSNTIGGLGAVGLKRVLPTVAAKLAFPVGKAMEAAGALGPAIGESEGRAEAAKLVKWLSNNEDSRKKE